MEELKHKELPAIESLLHTQEVRRSSRRAPTNSLPGPSSSGGPNSKKTLTRSERYALKLAAYRERHGLPPTPLEVQGALDFGPDLASQRAGARRNTRKGDRHRKIPAACLYCQREFLTSVGNPKRGRGKYCSPSCNSKAHAYNLKPYQGHAESNAHWQGGFDPAEHVRRFKAKFPAKAKAHAIFRAAIAKGTIVRPDTCSQCGATGVQIDGHHDDYSKPLEVRWLCQRCHHAHHDAMRRRA